MTIQFYSVAKLWSGSSYTSQYRIITTAFNLADVERHVVELAWAQRLFHYKRLVWTLIYGFLCGIPIVLTLVWFLGPLIPMTISMLAGYYVADGEVLDVYMKRKAFSDRALWSGKLADVHCVREKDWDSFIKSLEKAG